MGMYAGYYRISDAELEQLRQLEERALLKRVEELTEDETAETCDLDKMWDALHFVLTGDTLSDAADMIHCQRQCAAASFWHGRYMWAAFRRIA